MENKPFKILSIDGGGIRGVFPAMFLTQVEAQLKAKGDSKNKIFQYFDLICGTSTGGIMAIALALGIPAKDIYDLYVDNASKIFGNKRSFFNRLNNSAHDRNGLEEIVVKKFREAFNGKDPRLGDCQTNICIPIYDLLMGRPAVLKTKHHESFLRDYHIPAYQVAMATSAAPTYFDPYSAKYTDLNNIDNPFSNKVDGGVVANNPTLIGIIEAQKAFGKQLSDLQVLSIGTGHYKYADSAKRTNWGIRYWMAKDGKTRLIDLFMQAQSQQTENLVSMLHKGIMQNEPDNFVYSRIDTELDESSVIKLDETNKEVLMRLAEKASNGFQRQSKSILSKHFS